jgi:hypothetical protein
LDNYKRTFLLLLLFIEPVGIGNIVMLQQGFVNADAQEAKIFENVALGARIPYPTDWSVEYEGLTVTFKSPDGNSAIQLSGILSGDDDLGLEEAAEAVLKGEKLSGPNFQILNRGPTSINGNDFYSLLLRSQYNNGVVAKNLYLLTEAGDTPYMFKLQSLDDPDNRELSDQLYSEGLGIMQQMIMSAELTGLNLDSLKEGLDGSGGGDFNPFEPNQEGQGGGFGDGQNPGGGSGNNDGSELVPPQQPSPSEPLCGPGSCIIS